jgi:hypothetical protein
MLKQMRRGVAFAIPPRKRLAIAQPEGAAQIDNLDASV